MNKTIVSLLCILFPSLVLASEGTFTFAPPPQDYSVVFLGNIFGVVDGVLHGTGSQIMGAMFGVFNSAVLALGGMIIMYTLLVSTMNTAHEGQMLGQKWSSIWVPMRSTLGLALLIPKASGYCLMQIFVMWIVVQGVGAADKVWEAALSYLNRGGVIVQTQMESVNNILGNTGSVEASTGAAHILTGQICMLGIQTILENQRQSYLSSKEKNSGPCSGTPSDAMQKFCNTAVPDFLSSVNAVNIQSQSTVPPTTATVYAAPMPNFDSSSPYAILNGICGQIRWNQFTAANDLHGIQLSAGELQTAQMSRAIAIQQMYMDLSSIAQIMISNDPSLNPKQDTDDTQTRFSINAVQQFGVPLTADNQPCDSNADATFCKATGWGQDPSGTSAPLFNGTEFQGAVLDYNAIMLPTLNLVSQASHAKKAQDERDFIAEANRYGWIMAGSYFFNLAKLNASTEGSANQTDAGNGLSQSSSLKPKTLQTIFANNQCSGTYGFLCEWLNKNDSKILALMGLINGANMGTDTTSFPQPRANISAPEYKVARGSLSSTVYGFINNSMLVQLPGQPGTKPPEFDIKFNINIDLGKFSLPSIDFPCGKLKIMTWSTCLGSMMADIFYNFIIKNMFNFFLHMVTSIINSVVMLFLSVPLMGIASIFKTGVAIIEQPTVNPVIALANMGVNYINFANEIWILLLTVAITTSLIPIFGLFIYALIMMVFPLLSAWMSVMLSIGFITAYYIPFLPYMIFTFGSIAWLMVVIEAMVAAPIVALGVTHPEGHEAFGKGEQAIMILLNVFLRPSMMIIGYIAAIALTYVSVWVINAGFANAMAFIQGSTSGTTFSIHGGTSDAMKQATHIDTTQGYTGWAGIYGFFFSILIYTTMYLIVVQRSFTLITSLPDKVLRWIGGQAESAGQEAAQWAEQGKEQVQAGAKSTQQAAQQIDSKLSGYGQKAMSKAKGAKSSDMSAKGGGSGTESTASLPEDAAE
ncbi:MULTISPECIES: type IVB secretion system protein DotA [unclassified Legionella]|uniref:type IVB secretion system protein DotA n=1 Tax=unclassified Legionella TaxID=2622702 RepID=UPI001055C8A4|nr:MULTISPECIES: type IVB secretion system protein DotA [unclassified Legionella]MDI9818678.1 type IVB secretion system protein DotA [Legionella sp. PL877]